MLAFLPPTGGAPRPTDPEPRPGTAIGILLAAILLVTGMLLPWIRPSLHDAPATPSHAKPMSNR